VLNAAVGEQAFQIALHNHQQAGHSEGNAAKYQQQSMAEAAANGPRSLSPTVCTGIISIKEGTPFPGLSFSAAPPKR
jgi:hypothetical protein